MHRVHAVSDGYGTPGAKAIPKDIALRAAEWYLLLQSNEADARAIEACSVWRAENPLHEQAWLRAVQVGETFSRIPRRLGGQVLKRPVRIERRRAAKALALAMIAVPAGLLIHRQMPLWTADYRSSVGERRGVVLADGTNVMLNTDTAIDVRYDEQQRLIVLHSGEILVESGKDALARPLSVATENGTVRALGTRFIVRQIGRHSHVSVLANAVEIRPNGARIPARRLASGSRTWFSATELGVVTAVDPGAGAWRQSVLVANNMRLGDFIDELSRYRRGLLRCDPAVADLRVTGAFQLDDSEAILTSLPGILPVDVLFRTRYWVTVGAPARR